MARQRGMSGIVRSRAVSYSTNTLPIAKLTPLAFTMRQMLRQKSKAIGLLPPGRYPPARPNTSAGLEVYDAESFPAIPSPLVCGVWRELLAGYPGVLGEIICGMITHGAKLGYSPSGELRFHARRGKRNLPMNAEGEAHIEEELQRRLKEGLIIRARDEEHLVTSPLGAVPKPPVNGVRKSRTIHNLSSPKNPRKGASVNAGIDSEAVTLRYSDMEKFLRGIGLASRRDPSNLECRTLWKVDLKDAYRHVVVEREDARLLGFYWPGLGFMYEGQLSFGGRSAPFLFNLVAEGFEWILHSFGVQCEHYLDDTFGWVNGNGQAQAVTSFVTDVAQSLGLATAPHKTLRGSVLEILGITIDCHRAVAYIGPVKMERIRELIRKALASRSTYLADIQSLAGSLVFVTRVCVVGRSFLRRIFDQVTKCMSTPLQRRRLTQDAKRELRWWADTLTDRDAIRYLADDPLFLPVMHVWSDASGSLGIGGHLANRVDQFSERIPDKHRNKDIMFKEALAVLRCVDRWKGQMERKLVIFNVDNQALVAALNKGGCRQRPTQAIVRRIYTLASWHSFSLRAVWLSSASNKRADDLSRFVLHVPSPAVDTTYDYAHFDPDLPADDMENDGDGLFC